MNTKNNFDKVVIIHGCPASPEDTRSRSQRWMCWLEDTLKEKEYEAFAPDMPIPWQPQYEEWKQLIEKYRVTENSLLIGHSCGAAFLVRYLLDTKRKVKKFILVAPAKIPEGENDKRKNLYQFDLPDNSSKIADEIVIFVSNDLPRHLKSLEIYKKALKPRIVEIENKGHFVISQFPEILKEII